jgi:cell wall-associated NlpC family hydrolase
MGLSDGSGNPDQSTNSTSSNASQYSIAAVIAAGQAVLGAPYVYGSKGPTTFDCSGFTEWCYLQGGGIDIGGATHEQYTSPYGTNIYDVNNGGTFNTDLLLPGDLIFYGTNGAQDGPDSHVVMYIGSNTVIGASGANVNTDQWPSAWPTPPAALDSSEPFQGVVRYSQNVGTGQPASGTVTVNSSSANPTSSSSSSSGDFPTPSITPTANLPDPRNNLPFSKYFQDRTISAGATSSGGTLNNLVPTSASIKLVRGGMSEINTQRPGGPFQFFFMMNPTNIDTNFAVDTTNIAPPTSSAPSTFVAPIQGIQVSFQVIVNRTYEVYMQDSPGPSDIGVRWDTRALERLLGAYDADEASKNSSIYTTPFTANGVGSFGTTTYPGSPTLQIAFGGVNSYQFQAYVTSVDYQFTMFSANMIPIEAYITLGLSIVYQPAVSADLVTNLVTYNGGSPFTPFSPQQPSASGSVTSNGSGNFIKINSGGTGSV